MSTHTPGPWYTSRDAVPSGYVQVTVYAENGARIATVFDREANAPLIAAAPDLLAALQDLVERCDGDEGVRPDGSNIQTMWAHAAIAKAEGTA